MKQRFFSLRFKIIGIIIALALCFLGIGYKVSENLAQKNIDAYFKMLGDYVASNCVYYLNGVGDGEEVVPEEYEEMFVSILGDLNMLLCKDLDILHIYVCKATDDENTAKCILFSTKDEYFTGTKTTEDNGLYELSQAEKDIFNNVTTSARVQYDSRDGLADSYISGVYNSKGECLYIIGMNVEDGKFQKLLRSNMQETFRMYALSILIIVFILAILLQLLVIKRILVVNEAMKHFVGDNKLNYEPLEVKGHDEITNMAETYNVMASDIKDFIVEKQQTLAEMNVAAQIQLGFLPKEGYMDEKVSLNGCMYPAKNVGGDFYLYEELENHRIGFAIGDVSGKGISASLLMASAITAMRIALHECESPAKVLERMNSVIVKNNPESLFVTIFVGIYNEDTNELTYSNAGHNPPYLVGDDLCQLKEAKGLLAGLFDDEEYENAALYPTPGSELILYTDGVTEAVSEEREFYGIERFEEVLRNHKNQRLKAVLDSVHDFASEAKQNDDITLLSVSFLDKKTDEIVVEAKTSSLASVKEFVLDRSGIPDKFKKKIYLAIEEIFANICMYGYEGTTPGMVELLFDTNPDEVIVTIKDDAMQYNPLEAVRSSDDYDIDEEIGGLGKLLAFCIMDESDYAYVDGKNVLTMKKHICNE